VRQGDDVSMTFMHLCFECAGNDGQHTPGACKLCFSMRANSIASGDSMPTLCGGCASRFSGGGGELKQMPPRPKCLMSDCTANALVDAHGSSRNGNKSLFVYCKRHAPWPDDDEDEIDFSENPF
jgi:hypothetical protein